MWATQNLEDLKYLVDFTISHEEWSLLSHFGEDAACGPKVDAKRVMLLTKKDFWAPIPESYDLVSISLDWETKCSGQPKVSEFDGLSILTDEQVLWLEISVEDSV